jgi:hypothetical protein
MTLECSGEPSPSPKKISVTCGDLILIFDRHRLCAVSAYVNLLCPLSTQQCVRASYIYRCTYNMCYSVGKCSYWETFPIRILACVRRLERGRFLQFHPKGDGSTSVLHFPCANASTLASRFSVICCVWTESDTMRTHKLHSKYTHFHLAQTDGPANRQYYDLPDASQDVPGRGHLHTSRRDAH